jgi:putative flavoprotein involved in K+ transport
MPLPAPVALAALDRLACVERVNVLVIGAGQAGLAMSAELGRRDVEHLVLERGRVGESWRGRWDSFCLVTPNWTIQLPDGHYDGDDPDGYLPRDEIVAFLERYAARIGAPVREGVSVLAVERGDDGEFVVTTSDGPIHARRLAVASGAYQAPHRPHADSLPASLHQVDVAGYRNPDSLPDGGVLIIGFGQSGGQLAEELHAAGRDVVLACGRAPWIPRRLAGRDIVWWALEIGLLDQPVAALADPAERLTANLQNSGRDGGHDLNYRTLQALGVPLVGRFQGASDGQLRFAPDLATSVAWGDAVYRQFMNGCRARAAEMGIGLSDIGEPPPFEAATPESLPIDRFGTVIWAGGYRPAYRSWLPWPDAFDADGFPIHHNGQSTAVPGLHFVGVHFLRKRKSSLLIGVGEDAAIVADEIAASA